MLVEELAGFLGGEHGRLAAATTCLGPRTACAGLWAMTWPVTSQSKSIRMAARCCLTVGAERCR